MPSNSASWLTRIRRVSVGLGVVGLIALVGLFYAADDGLCGNTTVDEYPSPDRALRLVVFERSCGATTGFTTQASILRVGEEFGNTSGNVFIADTDHGRAPSGPWGGPWLDVEWEGPHRVVLRRDPRARVFLAVLELRGVGIRYLSDAPHFRGRDRGSAGLPGLPATFAGRRRLTGGSEPLE